MEIAIINPDTLSAIGLKKLLSEISEEFIIRTFADYGTFADDTPDMYTWYFVSSQTYVLYNSFSPSQRKNGYSDARHRTQYRIRRKSYIEYFPSGENDES